MIAVLFMLLVGHAIADYPLQGDFLARGKNSANPLPGIPWYQCLAAHALIHAGSVYLITGSMACALMELAAHIVIDDLKCTGKFGSGHRAFNIDQALHFLCKLAWCLWLVATK